MYTNFNNERRETIPGAVMRYDNDNGAIREMKQAVFSRTFKALFTRDPGQAVKGIKNLIEKAYAWRKSKDEPMDPRDLVELAGTLSKVIAEDYGGLFPSEIEKIFENGTRKRYGEIYGITMGTFTDWIEAYLATGNHHDFVMKLFEEQKAAAMKRLPEHASADDIRTLLLRNYSQYREGILASEHQRIRAGAAIQPGAAFAKVNPGAVRHAAGSPLWDYDGTEFAGARARWMNEHGYQGANLKEIFDNMIRKGIERF